MIAFYQVTITHFYAECRGLSDFPVSSILQRIFQYFGAPEVKPEQTSFEVNASRSMTP